MNLSSLLDSAAARFPDRIAVASDNVRLSYSDLDRRVRQVADLLVELGITPADRVALSCPNIPEFTIVYYGILRAGATVVPLNILLKRHEVAYHLQDSDATAYFCHAGTAGLPMGDEGYAGFQIATETGASCRHFITIDGEVPRRATDDSRARTLTAALAGRDGKVPTHDADDDDTSVILYTSGTTGRPKGAELTHRNMRQNARTFLQMFGQDPSRHEVYLCTLPLFHSFGQTVVQNAGLVSGATLIMLERFGARRALEIMSTEGVTFFAGVPTMYWEILRAVQDSTPPIDTTDAVRSLRVAVSGGAALPQEVHRQFERLFGVRIAEGYGLSETSPVVSFTPPGEPPRVGSIGKPIPGVDMKLINPQPGEWGEIGWSPDAIGEIAVKGPNVMTGYHNRPEATAEAIRDGWFRTGDLARRDADGWYYIVDRSKDMIIRGGYNVYPREIEEVLLTHPKVSLAAVVGVPHPSHGEEIKAYVIPKESDSVTPAEIVEWGKEQFAGYKYPRLVEIVDSLPMTSTGKILKRELGR